MRTVVSARYSSYLQLTRIVVNDIWSHMSMFCHTNIAKQWSMVLDWNLCKKIGPCNDSGAPSEMTPAISVKFFPTLPPIRMTSTTLFPNELNMLRVLAQGYYHLPVQIWMQYFKFSRSYSHFYFAGPIQTILAKSPWDT